MPKLTPDELSTIRTRSTAWLDGHSPGRHAAQDRDRLLAHIDALTAELEDVTAAYHLTRQQIERNQA